MEDSAADLCSRCSSIPWDHLEEKIDDSELWEDEEQILGDLQTSSCRLCRLILSAIVPLYVQHAHFRCVLRTRWRRRSVGIENWLGSIHVGIEPGRFMTWLILTNQEATKEDVTTWSIDAPKRVDFIKVRSWLEVCKASHESCEPETPPQLFNLRVVDCVKKAVVVAPIDCSFAALSYVWGGELSAESYVLGTTIAFPPTIEDAVRSTLELGYRYLWVDRYVSRHEYSIELN